MRVRRNPRRGDWSRITATAPAGWSGGSPSAPGVHELSALDGGVGDELLDVHRKIIPERDLPDIRPVVRVHVGLNIFIMIRRPDPDPVDRGVPPVEAVDLVVLRVGDRGLPGVRDVRPVIGGPGAVVYIPDCPVGCNAVLPGDR